MSSMKLRACSLLLALALPAASSATTAALLPVDNAAAFGDAAVAALTEALRAELEREADLVLVAEQDAVDLRVQVRLARTPEGAQLVVEVRGPDDQVLGTSAPRAVTELDVAARGREALAEARQRRATTTPAGTVTAPPPTTVDGVTLKPAGTVVTTAPTTVDGVTLKPAGAVVQPTPETIEVPPEGATAGSGETPVPVKPAGDVVKPQPDGLTPAGDVVTPQPDDLTPAGDVIQPGTETIPDPETTPAPAATPEPPATGAAAGSELTTPAAAPGDPYRYAAWAVTGVTAALGIAAFAVASQVHDEADPAARDDQILIAQVTGGLAGAMAVTAVTLFLIGADADRAATAGICPIRGGAITTVGGRF